MLLGPLAVLPLAVLAAGLGRLADLTAWPSPLPGLVVVAALALGTRALHLDGLADTVDGLGSGRDRTRALEIMRRGDIGPMGVVALILVLGAQAAAASALTGSWQDTALLAVGIAASRSALLIACRTGVPAARPGGLGAAVAGSVRAPSAACAYGASVLILLGAVVAVGRPWLLAVVAVCAAGLVASGIVRLAVRRFGGITGDVLGATVEFTLAVLLVGLTIGIPR
jgi:adenosylcobinamide-GDP ribazoletransferase